jgi:hypothetical protein
VQYAIYWVNGTEQIVPAPPDDPHPTLMTATAVSGDGSTLLVEDTTGSSPSKVETYVYKVATQTFTSVGYLGTATQQTYGAALNYDGSVAAGYSNLDNGDNDGFRWTGKSGLQDLGVPQPGTFYVEPTCMSDDGTVIFGRYTVGGGWVGFRYTTSGGFQDTGGISISGCTADGTEAFGIENLYFPAIWTTTVGSGYIDFLLKAHGINAKLGDLMAPVTISTVSLSAGNNISNASSERVTSLAVPNTVTVFRKDTVPKRVDIRSGVAKRCEPSKLSGASEPAGTGYPATSETRP